MEPITDIKDRKPPDLEINEAEESKRPKSISGSSIPLHVGIATKEDYEVCRQIMRSASKNYSFASLFFSKDKLPHVEALYALMRVGDDRVDVSHQGFRSPLEAIEDWEQAYWKAYEIGDSPNPVMRAYLNTSYEFNIPPETMKPYFRAMKDDLTVTRFPTFGDLVYYMEGSAITVGRAMTHILGVKKPHQVEDAIPYADSLSIAMQLSNFWRDIGQDWQIGRVYLPLEDMQQFRVSERDLARSCINQNFIDLIEFQIERTDQYYQNAQAGVPMLASGGWAVRSGSEIYRSILGAIRKNHYDVFNHNAGPGLLKMTFTAVKAYLDNRGMS